MSTHYEPKLLKNRIMLERDRKMMEREWGIPWVRWRATRFMAGRGKDVKYRTLGWAMR